jgi:hypothetical protein
MKNAVIFSAFLLLLGIESTVAQAEEAPSGTTPSADAQPTGAAAPEPQSTPAPEPQSAPAPEPQSTPAAPADSAREALKQKSEDATSEKNLEQVFQASEKTYSLLKAGKISLQYDVDYSYYGDYRVDLATAGDSSQITRFRIEQDAQHSLNNSFELSYGYKDNLTFTASMPLVAKVDTQKDLKTTGLGDVALGLRWQPIPLKRGLPSSTLFATLSTATGDSPYEIDVVNDMATGKGYYSLSAGASVSKLADPIVLFASGSYTMSTQVSGLNQFRGGRVLESVEPGDSLGASMGFAYSLNYDVSITASYQQSYAFATTYNFKGDEFFQTAPATSASLNFSLGLRTNPKRIVNLSLGYGLTEDTPDVVVGFSMPIDFLGSSDE